MLKRMMLIVLTLVFLVSGAQAQSIFDVKPAATVNFGEVVGMKPDSVKTNAFTGQTTEVYVGLNDEQFNDYGVALGEADYIVTDREDRAEGLYFEVSKDGGATIFILYNQSAGRMEISYGAAMADGMGVAEEKTQELPGIFSDCQQISYGEQVKIPGYGRFTIEKLVRGKKTDMLYSDMFIGTTKYPSSIEINTYLVGHFENTATQKMKWNHVMNCTLYYIEENVYTYKDWLVLPLQSNGVYIGSRNRSSGINFDIDSSWPFGDSYNQPLVDSLSGGDFAAVFSKVPEVVQKTDEGMLAVVIECNGNKYVVVDQWE